MHSQILNILPASLLFISHFISPRASAEIATLVPMGTLVAVDSSAAMIDFAKQNYQSPNIEYRLQDAMRLPFKSEFDVVVSFATLHWVTDHRALLNGIYSSLRPGGTFFSQFGAKGNAAGVTEIAEAMTKTPEWAPYFSGFSFPWSYFSLDEYRALLHDAGFTIKAIDSYPREFVHQTRDDLTHWITYGWNPYLERLPETLRDKFKTQIVESYLETHPRKEGQPIRVGMMRLEVNAFKPVTK